MLIPVGVAKKGFIAHRFLQRKMDEYGALKDEIDVLKMEVCKIYCNDHKTSNDNIDRRCQILI